MKEIFKKHWKWILVAVIIIIAVMIYIKRKKMAEKSGIPGVGATQELPPKGRTVGGKVPLDLVKVEVPPPAPPINTTPGPAVTGGGSTPSGTLNSQPQLGGG